MAQTPIETDAKTIRRALVLSGGGARGAYEVGVLQALSEFGLSFDLVFGTSIGAVNAVFFVQQSLERLQELWSSWRPRYVIPPTIFQACRLLLGRKWSLYDTQPLEELLAVELDLNRLHASPTEAGFIITDLCSLTTRLITTRQLESIEALIDVLMATCALPCVFPPRRINGKGLWIDGGIVRNTPILAALKMGATEIYAVTLHGDNPHACPVNVSQYLARCVDVVLTSSAINGIELVQQCNLLTAMSRTSQPVRLEVLRPRRPSTVGLLDFKPALSRELMREGYEDTCIRLSALGKRGAS